jgi:hypothetical protein
MLMVFAEMFSDSERSYGRSTVNQGHRRGNEVSHCETPVGLSRADLRNPSNRDCRTLETATGAASYLPLRVFYFAHARQTLTKFTQTSRQEEGKKKANAFGLACRLFGVSTHLQGHANPMPENVKEAA